MSKTINLKKKKRTWRREIVVVFSAIVLTAAGIKASDGLFSPPASENEGGGRCPREMVLVSSPGGDFCLDKYENSAGSGCPFDNPLSQANSRDNIVTPGCQPVSAAGGLPWRNISQNQAAEACAKAGKRLPTNKEWLLAAYGTPDKATDWQGNDCQVANNWPAQPGPAGSGADCVSAAGAYDMIGNVWEWVDGSVHEGGFEGRALPRSGFIRGVDSAGLPSDTSESAGDADYYFDYFWVKDSGVRGLARGGYWGNKSEAGQYAIYAVTQPAEAGAGIGFRCVK